MTQPQQTAVFVKVNGAWRFEGLEPATAFTDEREELLREQVETDNGPGTLFVTRLPA